MHTFEQAKAERMMRIDARRERRRRFWDRLIERMIRLAGISSIAILLAIFALLLVNAAKTFRGGIEMRPLTTEERQGLSAETVVELNSRPSEPPDLFQDFISLPGLTG